MALSSLSQSFCKFPFYSPASLFKPTLNIEMLPQPKTSFFAGLGGSKARNKSRRLGSEGCIRHFPLPRERVASESASEVFQLTHDARAAFLFQSEARLEGQGLRREENATAQIPTFTHVLRSWTLVAVWAWTTSVGNTTFIIYGLIPHSFQPSFF